MVPYQPKDLERNVVDAEIVEPRDAGPVRLLPASTEPRRVAAVVARGTLRHAATVAIGFQSWASRAWDASTMGTYRRQIRAAEASGDRAALAEWVERRERAVTARHARLMELPTLAAGLAKVAGGLLVGLVLLVLLVAVLVAVSGTGAFGDVITGVVDFVGWVIVLVTVSWLPLVLSTPLLLVLLAWREGKRRGTVPTWLATAADADADVSIDETTIAKALDALRITGISAELRSGRPLQFVSLPRLDGRGTHAVVRLPAGVTADRVARRRADLASGLYRSAQEVWPTTGEEAGLLDLWIADKGALAEGAGPYPLLDTVDAVDVFDGVPIGRTLRGDPVRLPIMERNTLVGGIPGQGKSAAARVMLAGVALDPTAEIRVYIPDSNHDFQPFRPRCSRYVMGAEAERVAEIAEDLRALHAEVQARGKLLIGHGEPQVTRALASAGVGLHPLVVLLEEAHVALTHPDHGREISQLVTDIVRLGRKRGVHLVISTQAPTKASMPRDITRNAANAVAFAVSDHVANDALLGQGAYSGGHRATELMPGTDRGTALVKGTGDQGRAVLVQTYFLDVSRHRDQVSPLVARAVDAQRPHAADAAESTDLLADLVDVLDGSNARASQVAARLRDRPGYPSGLTGVDLARRLADEYGITVRTRDGHPTVRVTDVYAAFDAAEAR